MIKIVATRCQILRLKCTKFDLGWGSAPNPDMWAESAPPDSLAGFKGLLKGREWRDGDEMGGEGIGREAEGGGGRERGKGKGRRIRTPLRIGLVTGLKWTTEHSYDYELLIFACQLKQYQNQNDVFEKHHSGFAVKQWNRKTVFLFHCLTAKFFSHTKTVLRRGHRCFFPYYSTHQLYFPHRFLWNMGVNCIMWPQLTFKVNYENS